jgi:flagella basal body P-ring formation protein FlgA
MLLKLISILIIAFAGNNPIDQYLSDKLDDYSGYEYEVVSYPAGMNELDFSRISIDHKKELRLNKQYAYIPVKVRLSADQTANSYITLKMKLYAKVYKTIRRINSNEKISPNQLELTEAEVSSLRSKPVSSTKEFGNLRAKYNISEGEILTGRMVEGVPVISRQQRIKAFKKVGSVLVSLSVRSREEGYVGEIIDVVDDKRDIFKAKVIDSKKVEIIE